MVQIINACRFAVLNIAHETHQGIVRTKQFLRARFYWPNMDFDVQQLVSKCTTCVLNQPLRNDTPLQPVDPAPRPWSKVGVDIVGPIDSVYVLTVIDYFSSYPFAVVIKDITSNTIIEVLERIFSEHGFPESIVSDNGRQFVSEQFVKYLRMAGIQHIRSSPYFPKSNGKIERFHRFLKKAFCSASADGNDWKRQLPRILQIYRATPHRATGETPAMLLKERDTFQIVNCDTGIISVRNAKFLRHSPCRDPVNFDNVEISDDVSRNLVFDRTELQAQATSVPVDNPTALQDSLYAELAVDNSDHVTQPGERNELSGSASPTADTASLRRSSRTRRAPAYLKEYVKN